MPPEPERPRPRVGYLGPQGTFSEEALLSSAEPGAVEPIAIETIREAVVEVQAGTVQFALVPIENSVEGSVTITLDTLIGQAPDVKIVGEVVLPVCHCLIAAPDVELEQIQTIVSHPHVPGQCTHFLREHLARASFIAASSTAEAVRIVASGDHPQAPGETTMRSALASERRGSDAHGKLGAIGTRLAAKLYECRVLAEAIQDREDNETRFVWISLEQGAERTSPPLRERGGSANKTSLVFWGSGAGQAGWLALCLGEFGRRSINLTKIESRPMRERLGQYMFFLDLEGSSAEASVSEALDGLRELSEHVRVLGSYPSARRM